MTTTYTVEVQLHYQSKPMLTIPGFTRDDANDLVRKMIENSVVNADEITAKEVKKRTYCGACGQQASESDYDDNHKQGNCDWMERRLAEEGLSRRHSGRVRF